MRSLACLLVLATLPTAFADDKVDYEKQIAPIFAARCNGCHGEKKKLGKLALHDLKALAEAEDNGVLVAEDAENSEVYARLILAADDKKRMPKGGEPLEAAQIELIKNWINGTSTFAVTATAEEETPAAAEEPALPAIEAAKPEAIAAVEKLGALVMPLYAGSNELRVSFPSGGESIDDAAVKTIAGLASALVELDLHGTAITDASAGDLASFKQLRKLHLENTTIGDATASAVAVLPGLEYLNVYGTKVTDASLNELAKAKRLKKLFVWQTAVSYEAAKKLEGTVEGLEVNLGWNHPGVVRERVTSELERVKQQVVDAEARAKEAQQTLDAANAEKAAATTRQAELEKQLAELNKPQ